MTQTDFSEFADIDNLEYDGESIDPELKEEDEDETELSIEDAQQTLEGRRVEDQEWRQREKERILKHIPELGE